MLRNRRALEDPERVGLLYGSLGALRRAGRTVAPDEARAWALESGWSSEAAWALSGIALAVRDGLPDIGTLSTGTAADGNLVVSLTRDEARVARSALFEVLYGLPDMHRDGGMNEGDLHAIFGYDKLQANAVLEALNEARLAFGAGASNRRACPLGRRAIVAPRDGTG
jgi:hypothetical protein